MEISGLRIGGVIGRGVEQVVLEEVVREEEEEGEWVAVKLMVEVVTLERVVHGRNAGRLMKTLSPLHQVRRKLILSLILWRELLSYHSCYLWMCGCFRYKREAEAETAAPHDIGTCERGGGNVADVDDLRRRQATGREYRARRQG